MFEELIILLKMLAFVVINAQSKNQILKAIIKKEFNNLG